VLSLLRQQALVFFLLTVNKMNDGDEGCTKVILCSFLPDSFCLRE